MIKKKFSKYLNKENNFMSYSPVLHEMPNINKIVDYLSNVTDKILRFLIQRQFIHSFNSFAFTNVLCNNHFISCEHVVHYIKQKIAVISKRVYLCGSICI